MDFTGTICRRIAKVKKIQKEIVANDCDILVDTCLENIAWTLNLRGNDVKCTPVFLSFLTITGDNVTLYIQKQSLTAGTESYLKENKVNIKDYFEIYNDLKKIKKSGLISHQLITE